MPNPVCVKCQVEYRCHSNGVALEEMAGLTGYKLWSADLWKCPVCGHEIIHGFGSSPIAEHYQENYSHQVEMAQKYGLYRAFEYRSRERLSKVG